MDPVAIANQPRKSTARLLWALFAIFVVYGTTFPFRFDIDWRSFLQASHRVNWLILGGRPGDPIISDIAQNILLFLPFGFLGYFSTVHKGSRLKKLAIVLLGAALSVSVEFLQMFSLTRWPAFSDVEFNTLGTALGLFTGVALKKSVLGFKSHPEARRFLDADSAFPAFIFFVLTVVGCWAPFDFTLSYGTLLDHIESLWRDPVRLSSPDDELVSFIRYLLTTLFVCRTAHEAGLRRPVLKGVAMMAFLGVALELSQIVVQSRLPQLQDSLVAVAGSAAGGIVWHFPGFHLRPRTWTLAGGLAVLASAAAGGLYPYHFTGRHSGFNWIFFLPRYERNTLVALGEFVESAMTFFPLGFLLAYFQPLRRPAAAAALLAGAMALAVEALQGYVPGRYPDVTDALGAMLGGLAGGLVLTRGWPAFRYYMANDEDRQV
ncbi:MAG: VanZ family protein [Fibrobacteria bacterium]